MNKTRLLLTRLVSIMALLLCCVGANAEDVITTYTFNSKSWGATPGNWTSGKDGNQFTANQGVQITTAANGANATSPQEFTNVSKIVVTYCTNASKGKGSVTLNVGEEQFGTTPITAPSSYGTTLRELEFTTETPMSGNVKITVACSTNSIYIYSISITESSEESSLTPAGLAFTTSTVECAVNDMIEVGFSKTTDADVTFTSSDEDVATYEDGVVYALSAGTATITAHSDATETYAEGNATLKVTVLPVTTTIAGIKTLATDTYAKMTIDDAVVTAVKGSYTYIQDATGGICLYDKELNYTVGQHLTGSILGTYNKYNGMSQIKSGADYSGLTAVDGEPATPLVVSIDDITESMYGSLVTINKAYTDALENKAIISQANNTNTLQFYNSLYEGDIPAYTTFNITGIVNINSSNVQILPRSAADIVENTEKITTITFDQESYTFYVDDMESTITATANSEGAITYSSSNEDVLMIDEATGEIMAISVGTAVVTATVAANNGYPEASKNVNVTVTEKPDWIFKETFDGCNSTGGNDDKWNGGISSGNITKDNTDWTFTSGYAANQCAKFGTGSAKGSATTPKLSAIPAKEKKDCKLTFKAAAWDASSEKTGLDLSIAGGGELSQTTITMVKGAWTEYTVYITGATAETQITFAAQNKSNNRFFLDEILIKEVQFVATTISAAGYATLYYSEKNLVVPEGVVATTYAVLDNELLESTDYKTGEEIPAGEAVVLKGEQGDYIFEEVLTTKNGKDADNMLKGSDVDAMTEGGSMYYKLSLNSAGELSSVGFYWGAEDGAAFTNPAHKAYLALPAAASVRSFFTFNDIETGVASIKAADEKQAVYSISGVRVQGTPKAGLYIVNGKKVMVK